MASGSPQLFLDTDGVYSSLSSPLTHEQLIKLSRSPIASRLHITKANYAIPIPFTLQLPPRLSKSAPNSPQKEFSSALSSPKKSPTRLLFSGSGYKPAAYGSDSESESETSRDYIRHPSGQKPPSVTQNRKKVAKFVHRSQNIPADQLSIIEESSTRTNSVKSKSLPTLPKPQDTAADNDRPLIVLGARGPSLSRKLLRKPPPDLILETTSSSPNESPFISPQLQPNSTADSSFRGAEKLETKHDTHAIIQPMNMDVLTKSINNNGQANVQQPTKPESMKQLPHTLGVRHALHLGDSDAVYQLTRRTFSDESQVSSVSSFNSFGDMNSFKFGYLPGPTDNENKETVLRQSSIMTTSSGSSWNSLQRSLDVSLKNTLSTMSPSSQSETPGAPKELPELPLEDIEDKTIEIAPLAVARHSSENSILPADSKETEEAEILQHSESIVNDDELLDSFGSLDYNNGDGKSFSFPNNLSNITNSTEAKRKNERNLKSSASYALVSSTGQIKIPDLEKETHYYRVAKASQLNSQLDEQLMEPIGFPGKAAREHFKIMYGSMATDSDSDSSFNSQFSKLQGNTKAKHKVQDKNNLPQKQLAPSVSSISPVRHTRRRSMYDINFESENAAKPLISAHSRSKSTMDIQSHQKGFEQNKLDEVYPTTNSTSKQELLASGEPGSDERDLQKSADETLQDIVIAEPPAKVVYPVDFRSASAIPKKPHSYASNLGPYYDRSRISSRVPENHPKSVSHTDSEHASSYHSSHTAGETLSTAPTDPESITIDLTKDDYDVCMIKRNDSTLSYRSVIEKTKDGQNVEVVLVDEDEEPSRLDRDDLLSIYSRYMGTWAPFELNRAASTLSSVSDSSEGSAVSWAASDTNFQVKTKPMPRRELPSALVTNRSRIAPVKPVYNFAKITVNQNRIPAPSYPKQSHHVKSAYSKQSHPVQTAYPKQPHHVQSKLPALNKKNLQYAEVKARPQVPRTMEQPVAAPQSKNSRGENSYFDYSSNPTYDFNSFIHQRKPKRAS